MKVERMTEIETNDIHVGDRIRVGKYTATCTDTTTSLFWFKSSSPNAALFVLDQYITNHCCLREAIQSEEVISNFADIRKYMVPFEDGDMIKITYGCGWEDSEVSRFRPIFLISLKKEDTMAQDTTKKSAPENEETVRNVLDTFNGKQRLVLYYIVGKVIENGKTILDVLDTLNDKQRLVLNYLVNKAVEDAKKGKTSEFDEDGNHDDTV